jgi:predicted TIM-barrel fold metal-dependent hydrolase
MIGTAPLVDIHTHYLPNALVDALERRDELPRISRAGAERNIEYGKGNVHPLLPRMVDIPGRLEDMEAQGIALAVLSVNVPGVDWFPPATGAAVAQDVNDELVDLVASHPGRLAAMATLPLQAPEAAAAELERAVGRGLKGAMIYSNAAGRPLDDPALRDVFDVAARLDAPLYIHPTFPLTAATVDAYALIPSLGFVFDTTTAAMRLILGGLFERHPAFKLILAHAGSLLPQLAGRIDYEAARHGNGHGALSCPPSEHIARLYTDVVCVWPPALRNAVALLGADRVMFGSDYPFWDPARSIATLDDAGVEDEGDARIRTTNASRLFELDITVPAAEAAS